MKTRALIALLIVALAAGCSKKKASSDSGPRLKAYVLDAAPAMEHPLAVDFDGKVELIGYKAPSSTIKPNQKVKVTLYWKVKQKVSGDWRLFTHVLDGSGDRVLSLDHNSPIRAGKNKPALPPSVWIPGKIYVDELSFKVPKRVKTDRIRIAAGLMSGDIRMPIVKGDKDSEHRAIVTDLKFQPSAKGSTRVPDVFVEKLETSAKLKIDGKLDEDAWQKAAVLGPFVDVTTGEPNKTFPMNGKARVLWNDQALYVGIEVEDKDVVGGFPADAKDPHLWTKDTVEIMIDPDWDRKNTDYYEIQINPQNLVFDSQWDDYNAPKPTPNGPFGHEDWSSELKSAVVIDGTIDKSDDIDKGYTIEAMLPWKAFTKAKKAPPELGDAWRVNFYAMRENSGVAWSPILGRGNFHRSSRFGRLHFVKKGFVPPGASASAATSASAAPSSAPPRASAKLPAPPAPKPAMSAK